MDDEFRFRILDDDGPSPNWVPDDGLCVWAWVFRLGVRVGAVWACQNSATGFLPNRAANGEGSDFDFEWMRLCRKLLCDAHEAGRHLDFRAVIYQLADHSEMFKVGDHRCSVSELRELLDRAAPGE